MFMTDEELFEKIESVVNRKTTIDDKTRNTFKIFAQYFRDSGDLKTAEFCEGVVERVRAGL